MAGYRLSLRKGDITLEECGAIVNAANGYASLSPPALNLDFDRMLSHGGGLAGAIVKRGGDIIQIESSQIVRWLLTPPPPKSIIDSHEAVVVRVGILDLER